MNELINKLSFDSKLHDQLVSLFTNNKDKIDELFKRCDAFGFASLIKVNDLYKLAVMLEYAEINAKPYYIDKGIDLSIYYDTMQDIVIWCENNNNKGLKNVNWISNHVKCELFKIGRLQYQLYKCKNKTLDYSYMPFDYGDDLIYVHIPQGEKLEFADCVESLKKANEFFAKYIPAYNYDFYFCESWLLYEENYAFMKPSCNILQFQSLFDIVYSEAHDEQAIERIFGKRQLIKLKYPENTSLQKSAKKYMLDGNKLGIGVGIISKYDI